MKVNTIPSFTAAGLLLICACKTKTTSSITDSTVTTVKVPVKADTSAKTANNTKPNGAVPYRAPHIKPQMQALIEKLENYGDKPIPQLTALEARKNHAPTDAVMELMKENNIAMPVFNLDTMGKDIPVNGGSILVAANGKGLPPTTIITDEIDRLQSEGMIPGVKPKVAGVTVDSINYHGVTHEFFGMGAIVPQAKDAEMYAEEQLKKAFGM